MTRLELGHEPALDKNLQFRRFLPRERTPVQPPIRLQCCLDYVNVVSAIPTGDLHGKRQEEFLSAPQFKEVTPA